MRIRGGWAVFLGAGLFGCGTGGNRPPAPLDRPFQGRTIAIGAVGNPAILRAASTHRGEWQETRGGAIRIVEAPVEPGATGPPDVLLFPGDRLGELVDAKALAVLPESIVRPLAIEEPDEAEKVPKSAVDPLDFADVVPAQRDRASKYGDDRMALPYGGTALVLVYRRDALEDETLAEEARTRGLTLGPPETWEQLDALATFLHGRKRDGDGDGKTRAGIALALGDDPEGLGLATFLARAAALGQHRDQYSFLFDADTMAPRIASPPFVEALAGFVALAESGPPGMAGFDAEAARAAFRSGEAAFLIDRAEKAASWTDPDHPARIGVAPLPGSTRVFDPARNAWETADPINRPAYLPGGGGWLVGVSASTQGAQREAAIDLARYLAGPEVGRLVGADRAFPMLSTRASAIAQGPPDPRAAAGVDPRLWARAVESTLGDDRAVVGLRIPGAPGYLAALDKARVAAAGGEPAERALKSCGAAWSAATARLGPEHQLWYYRRSLNRLATVPGPPPRGR